MGAGKGKVWHRFADEKPTESGRYACLLRYGDDAISIHVLPYYTASGKFNCPPNGDEDLEICPTYWARVDGLIDLEGCDLLKERGKWTVL